VASGVFSPFKEYSLWGYKNLRGIPLVPAVGVRSGHQFGAPMSMLQDLNIKQCIPAQQQQHCSMITVIDMNSIMCVIEYKYLKK